MTTIVSKISNWFSTIFTIVWLSISSINFYQRVISSYDGYGIKYILTISFISSLLCSIFILNYLDNVRQYFSYGTISPSVINLDHILSQFPELKYDGNKISLENPEPVYINNVYNQLIAAIDPENKMSQSDKAKVSILLASRNIIFSFTDSQKTNVNSFSVDYQQIFGKESQLITQEVVRSSLEKFFDQAPKILTYMVFPLLGLLIFFNTFLEKSFIIIMIYLLANFMSIKFSMKICTRLTMFASGIFVILQPTILLIAPTYSNLMWIIQIWANLLMVLGILKFSNQGLFRIKK